MEFSKKKKSLYKTESPTQENAFVKGGIEAVSRDGKW